MLPKVVTRASAGSRITIEKKTPHKKQKSYQQLYLTTCTTMHVHPNSAFRKLLPDTRGSFFENTVIDLSRNYVGNRGLAAVLVVLAHLSTVTHLILSQNGLRNAAVRLLCTALIIHPSIVSLDLSDNFISEGAGKDLLYLVQNRLQLVELIIHGTRIPVDLRVAINDAILYNKSLIDKPQDSS